MRGQRQRTSLRAVHELLQRRLQSLSSEALPQREASGRVLAVDVMAQVAVPGFARAAMDGYAVRSGDTTPADGMVKLQIVGEALPGHAYTGTVGPGEATRIMTGAPVPAGADAVVPVEITQETGSHVQIQASIAPGRHICPRGEDVAEGATVLRTGRVLRPQDVGMLASIGCVSVAVIRRPSVAILITGNELLPAGAQPVGYQVVDSNSVMLEALVRRDGGQVEVSTLLRDDPGLIAAAMRACTADALLVSGGTSVGQEDHAARVLAEIGEVSIHGIAMRPGGPTGIGFRGQRPVFLLPGNPVACLCAYDLIARRAIRRLGGRGVDLPYRTTVLPLAEAIPSVVSRCDYVRVCVRGDHVDVVASGGASRLSSTTQADGFVLVPPEVDHLPAGTPVTVHLYDA
jgi:molybdopterin molybdotransferase